MGIQWGPIIAAGIEAAAAGGAAWNAANINSANRVWNEEQAQKQRDYSTQMMNAQNAWNYEMWQKENEYNTPEAQVQRLRDAGLNPLYYGLDGTGNANALESAQPLGYERAEGNFSLNPLVDVAKVVGDIPAKIAQVANIQADTAKKTEETLTEVQRREHIQAEIVNIKQQYNNLVENEALTKAERELVQKNLEWLDRINEATVAAANAKASFDAAQEKRILELLPGEKELQNMSIEDFEHQWALIQAQISKLAKETELDQKDIENYALNHMSNGVMGSGISVQNIGRGLERLANRVKNVVKDKIRRNPNYQGEGILAEDMR